MSIGQIVAWKSDHEKRASRKGLLALIISTRGNHAQWLFDRGQEIVKLLPPMAVAKTDNHATRSNYMAVQVSRYMEHGNRRILTLSLCRRRTV